MKKIITLLILALSITSVLKAEDFTAINLKYTTEYNSGYSYIDGFGSYIEIETIAKKGNVNFYGFTDLRYYNSGATLDYDYFKYNLKYDLTNSNELLFLNIEAKETYDFKSDMFLGLGSSIDIPVFGKLYGNIYYFLNYNDTDSTSKTPLSIEFNWFGVLYENIIDGWDLAHGGWGDIDLYNNNIKEYSDSRASIQIYEGLSLQHKDYAIELGYKYWVMNVDNNHSNSVYFTLIKKF